jgi:glycosyltransferase involved in cell wall biosynthesis
LPRKKVFELYKKSHIFLLPSDSEGFPKVLAEAANFGCIPVVSDISCLSDYVIEGRQGWLFDLNDIDGFKLKIENALSKSADELKNMALKMKEQSKLFTFDHYNYRIKSDILMLE